MRRPCRKGLRLGASAGRRCVPSVRINYPPLPELRRNAARARSSDRSRALPVSEAARSKLRAGLFEASELREQRSGGDGSLSAVPARMIACDDRMPRIDQIADDARALGIRPWIGVKQQLADRAIRIMAHDSRAVLQGGAALHFVYGSPRLSQDVDFVGEQAFQALSDNGPNIARAAADLLEHDAVWSLVRSGRLLRGKVTVTLDPARRLVLPVEAYEVRAHTGRRHGELGDVEDPVEIAADKIVASRERLAHRGVLKTRDLFDLWYIGIRLGSGPPSHELVTAKLADYGASPSGADLVTAVRAVSVEELTASLEGVLPESELAGLDVRRVWDFSAELFGK
jgi:hypothetical protein